MSEGRIEPTPSYVQSTDLPHCSTYYHLLINRSTTAAPIWCLSKVNRETCFYYDYTTLSPYTDCSVTRFFVYTDCICSAICSYYNHWQTEQVNTTVCVTYTFCILPIGFIIHNNLGNANAMLLTRSQPLELYFIFVFHNWFLSVTYRVQYGCYTMKVDQ